MSTSNNSSHLIRLFSNASSELFQENTLSSFTNRLAKPIYLSPEKEYEIGLKQLFVPHLIHQDSLHVTRNDIFHFHNDFNEKLIHPKSKWKINEFTDFLAILNPNSSDIYTDYYFRDYLKNDIHYSGLSFMRAHSSDFPNRRIEGQPEIIFEFDLHDFLHENEQMSHILSDLATQDQAKIFGKFHVKYYKGLAYTAIQILNNFIFNFLATFQTSMGVFSQLSIQTLPSSYRKFAKKLDDFCLRITKAYAENLRNSLMRIKEVNKYSQNSDILLVYCDACELSYVGDKLAKVLAVIVPPYTSESEKNIFIFPSPSFIRLESTTLTDIKILICNQYGDIAHFSSSITPSFVELIIRPAERGIINSV